MSQGVWWESFFDADYIRISGPRSRDGEEEAASLWRILGLSPGSRVLDAPCGYGRVSVPLARLGALVLGVDQSAPMLAEAELRRGDVGTDRLRFLRQDLRTPLGESGFDAALNLFSSLGYGSEEDDLAILRTLAGAVRAGGAVAIDTAHRDVVVAWVVRETTLAERLPDGTLVLEEPRFDAVAGRIETTWHWAGPAGAGRKSASVRVYSITELVSLVRRAGLELEGVLHPDSGAPFEAKGARAGGRVLIVARRPR